MAVEFNNRLNDTFFANKTEQALEMACLVVEAQAKQLCPVDDGTLRESITHEVSDGKGIVGTNIEYAPYVHQGTGIYAMGGNGRKDVPWHYKDQKTGEWRSTKGIQPTPFLSNAVANNKPQILKIIQEVLSNA